MALDVLADVAERSVDVAVSNFDGVVDCALGFFGAGLPRYYVRCSNYLIQKEATG